MSDKLERFLLSFKSDICDTSEVAYCRFVDFAQYVVATSGGSVDADFATRIRRDVVGGRWPMVAIEGASGTTRCCEQPQGCCNCGTCVESAEDVVSTIDREVASVGAVKPGDDDFSNGVVDSVGVSSNELCGNKSANSVFGHERGRQLSSAVVRGPNYERNKANREAAKRRKAERKKNGYDWRKRGTVDGQVGGDRKGFWNSCSADVRQELIDSKARMHIARNEEEVRKCKAAKAKEESPETLLRNIYRIIELGEQKAKEVNNVKVSNWMGDVAVGCAETMASSAPSSLPSFKELSEKLAASSQSSFDLTLHAKDVEIFELQNELKASKDELKVQQLRHDSVVEDLNEVIDDLRLSETMAENRFSCLAKPKVKKPVEPKYFTAEQQRNHRQLTTRDMNGPFFH